MDRFRQHIQDLQQEIDTVNQLCQQMNQRLSQMEAMGMNRTQENPNNTNMSMAPNMDSQQMGLGSEFQRLFQMTGTPEVDNREYD